MLGLALEVARMGDGPLMEIKAMSMHRECESCSARKSDSASDIAGSSTVLSVFGVSDVFVHWGVLWL
jgi:hypothetical protein